MRARPPRECVISPRTFVELDPETEQVVDDEEADNLLSGRDRGYRAPFVIPDEV